MTHADRDAFTLDGDTATCDNCRRISDLPGPLGAEDHPDWPDDPAAPDADRVNAYAKILRRALKDYIWGASTGGFWTDFAPRAIIVLADREQATLLAKIAELELERMRLQRALSAWMGDLEAQLADERAKVAELTAEVERLRGPFRCCEHCADDVIHDVEPDKHSVSCQLCDDRVEAAEAKVARVEAEIAGLRRANKALRDHANDLSKIAAKCDLLAIEAAVAERRAEAAERALALSPRQGQIVDWGTPTVRSADAFISLADRLRIEAALAGPAEPEAHETGADLQARAEKRAREEWDASTARVTEGPWESVGVVKRISLITRAVATIRAEASETGDDA